MSTHAEGANGAATPPPPAVVQPTPAREFRVVQDVIPVLDTARFEHMQRIATAMAKMSVIPDSLCTVKEDGSVVQLPFEVIAANCFMVVNQAVRWNMDPFAVAQAVSIVHGKLCYEGKLIHAVIEAKLGIRLTYTFANEGKGNQLEVTVSGQFADEDKPRTIEGDVANWHKGAKSPWANEKDWKRQLRYRGAREWARAHAPGVILGVYSDDEMDDLREERRMRDITPRAPSLAPPAPPPQLITPPTPPPLYVPTTAAPAKPPVTTVTPEATAQASKTVTVNTPPAPPAHLRGDQKPAVSGEVERGAAGQSSQEKRAPAPPPSPPSPDASRNATSAKPNGGGEAQSKPARINPAKYLENLEHEITSCESMADVQKIWERHEALIQASPKALSEEQINAALGFYFDAQQVLDNE